MPNQDDQLLQAAYEKRVLAELNIVVAEAEITRLQAQSDYLRDILAADDVTIRCAPDGELCYRCNGTHNPYPGCTYVTDRNWTVDDDEDGA